jgi:CubicO group peptidase (beta-lactamase class C family)
VLRGGRIVAGWGDPGRADQTYSIAKSYLAILAGLALARGLMRSLDAPVAETAIDGDFASAQNRAITWRHFLQLTSEWQGTLFDRPDTVDHHRVVGLTPQEAPKGTPRALKPPGTHFEYNDVRVNRLSLSLMQLFDEELPDVLRREVMTPIGASPGWKWEGYRNSAVDVRGRRMVSVPGGTHWGGGISISALDHARVGLLVARDGMWGGRRVLPEGWAGELRRPSPVNPGYGLLWWLNTGRRQLPAAPESSFFALGAGSHVIWIEPAHDLVVVLRWILKTAIPGFAERLMAALRR